MIWCSLGITTQSTESSHRILFPGWFGYNRKSWFLPHWCSYTGLQVESDWSPGNYGDLTWENAWCAFHSTDADTVSCTFFFFLTLSWTGEGGSKLKLFFFPGADEARMIQASVFKGGSGGFKHVCCSRSYVIVMDPGITSWSLYGVRYPRTWTSVNTKIKKASQTQKDEGRHRQLIPE